MDRSETQKGEKKSRFRGVASMGNRKGAFLRQTILHLLQGGRADCYHGGWRISAVYPKESGRGPREKGPLQGVGGGGAFPWGAFRERSVEVLRSIPNHGGGRRRSNETGREKGALLGETPSKDDHSSLWREGTHTGGAGVIFLAPDAACCSEMGREASEVTADLEGKAWSDSAGF